MKIILVIAVLAIPNISTAQKLPGNLTCQDLIDYSNGKLSRSNDGGKTFVPIKVPKPNDTFGYALISHATHLCHRLSRKEITVEEYDALYAEKVHQLRLEKAKLLAERHKLQNQERALQNQERALQNQRESVKAQREGTVEAARQAELSRQQREAHHQDHVEHQRIQQRQLEEWRQEQSRPKSLSCYGGGGYIHCNY